MDERVKEYISAKSVCLYQGYETREVKLTGRYIKDKNSGLISMEYVRKVWFIIPYKDWASLTAFNIIQEAK